MLFVVAIGFGVMIWLTILTKKGKDQRREIRIARKRHEDYMILIQQIKDQTNGKEKTD